MSAQALRHPGRLAPGLRVGRSGVAASVSASWRGDAQVVAARVGVVGVARVLLEASTMRTQSRDGRQPEGGWQRGCRLLVAHVPFDMSELELLETFRSHGAVRRAWLARDAATGKRRGHGYVEVESRADAERLVMRFNGRLVDGNAFSVAPVGR